MRNRNPTRSGNPAVPRPPKLSMVSGRLAQVADRQHTHEPDAYGHRWIVLAMHQVDPRPREFYLAEATLVEAHTPRCTSCGVPFSAATAESFCPGVRQDKPDDSDAVT